MRKKLLQRISLASAMALYIQPLLSMESTNTFKDYGQPNINRDQGYTKQIYQTVSPVLQPPQYNSMPQIHQPLMPSVLSPGNHLGAEGDMNVMQQRLLNPLQGQLQQGMKRKQEPNTVRNNDKQKIKLENTPVVFERFGDFNNDIKNHILQIVCISNLKEIDKFDKLKKIGNPLKLIKLVCKDWKSIVDGNKPFAFANEVIRSAYSLTDDEFKIYQRFVKGKLIYRPERNSDKGVIEHKISDLWNPLKGTFNLSQCGRTAQHLSISTGYRQEKKAENVYKAEIWLTPRFLVDKELHGTASYFKNIFPDKWAYSAAVGIIWTWGSWENSSDKFDYLTTENMDNLSKNNLYENWYKSWRGSVGVWEGCGGRKRVRGLFSCFICELK